jgi:HPt (histidine-containing phosphotransfer) domain-containing protein
MEKPTDIVDLDEAARRIPGGPEALKELAQVLVEESTQRLQKMRDALANGDAAAVGREAHPLKSAAAVFGARAVVEAAERVEHMGREGKLEEVKAGFAELEKEAARLHAALRSVVGDDRA